MNNLKQILSSDAGKELRDFISVEANKLRDINNLKEYSNAQDQAIEFKANKKALIVLEGILRKIGFADADEPLEKPNYYPL